MSATNGNGNLRAAIDDVKNAARGKWRELLTTVGGFNGKDLDGRHHACPKCEGTDRFRWDNEKEFAICNQCFHEKNSDGLAAIGWRNDWTFGETVNIVALHLGINRGERKPIDIVA